MSVRSLARYRLCVLKSLSNFSNNVVVFDLVRIDDSDECTVFSEHSVKITLFIELLELCLLQRKSFLCSIHPSRKFTIS